MVSMAWKHAKGMAQQSGSTVKLWWLSQLFFFFLFDFVLFFLFNFSSQIMLPVRCWNFVSVFTGALSSFLRPDAIWSLMQFKLLCNSCLWVTVKNSSGNFPLYTTSLSLCLMAKHKERGQASTTVGQSLVKSEIRWMNMCVNRLCYLQMWDCSKEPI